MCGRYEAPEMRTAEEILGALLEGKLDSRFASHEMAAEGSFEAYPGCTAPVILMRRGKPAAVPLYWGFQGAGGRPVFNARQESALEKPMFRESVLRQRCVIPTLGYYEWNRAHQRFRFLRERCQILLLAGIYTKDRDRGRFCVLTTEAETSLQAIHPRMPVILRPEDISGWFSGEAALPLMQRSLPLQANAE